MFSQQQQPSAEARLQLPNDFGRRFLITIDTEEEFDWSAPFERSGHTTITVPMLEKFQRFVEKYGIKPVYFVDYSIIENDEAAAFLKQSAETGNATIGVHLHPWVNPPFDEEVNDHNSFAGNLPRELEEAKMMRLRDRIEERTGVVSKIYRAGRYGVGQHTIEILSKLGFEIDSSVRSRFDYSKGGGPDFHHLDSKPFWLNQEKGLLELPLTTIFSGPFRQQSNFLSGVYNNSSLANAVLSKSKLLQRIPLTPEGISAREAKEAIDIALDDDLKILVFSFHSPSLSPGHTPYVRTEDDLHSFYNWWRDVIAHLDHMNVKPLDIASLAAIN